MEQTLDLKMLGIVELNKEELIYTSGGWRRLVLAHLAALAAEAVYEGIDKCLADFAEGFNETYDH